MKNRKLFAVALLFVCLLQGTLAARAEETEAGVAGLAMLGETEVGAAWEKTDGREAGGVDWSFDNYYVNQADRYHVEKNRDFSLKYQMEFHSSRDLEANAVEIRIPCALLTYRDGTEVKPSDIGVPKVADRADFKESRSTPFNCCEEDGMLVFFNYRDIPSGSNAAWQVLYKNLRIMDIVDETEWTLTPEISVEILLEGEEVRHETGEGSPLTGSVDSFAQLTSVSKEIYTEQGKSYTPGLYTEEQVRACLGRELPQPFAGENFKKYKFVAWDVKVKGNGTQPWNLAVRDTTRVGENGAAGSVVGYRACPSPGYGVAVEAAGEEKEGFLTVKTGCRESDWGSRFLVVTAYPAGAVREGTRIRNGITVQLEPVDQKDAAQRREAEAQWSYTDYHWSYPPGELFSVSKKYSESYEGWLEVYRRAVADGKDCGSFSFTTRGSFRGYSLTHAVGEAADGGLTVGTRKNGTSCTLITADDFLYAYPAGAAPSEQDRLGGEDYYFTEVRVVRTDEGYDVWEDRRGEPETAAEVPQSTRIYAMYGKPEFGSVEEWQLAAVVDWQSSGRMEYRFTPEQLAMEPWRVKVEQTTVNYITACSVEVSVRLRAASPKMQELLCQQETGVWSNLRLENISGVFGTSLDAEGRETVYYAPPGGSGRADLEAATGGLYGGLLYRESAVKTLSGLQKHASAFKTVKGTNDPVNSRVLLRYCLTAQDGYEVYAKEGVEALKAAGISSPGRKAVAFYDLLPYGVHLDPSEKMEAGRILSLSGNTFQTQPGSWNQNQVTVRVDSKSDIIENWRGTGRTMVIFHLCYSGADPAVYTEKQWMEGWGVSFQAYYDWKDLDVVQAGTNICAFLPEERREEPLLGTDSEVAYDNGREAGSQKLLSGVYEPFAGGKLYEGEQNGDVRNVLYAKAGTEDEVALANESGIEKLVRADSDRFAVYGKSALVEMGGSYTYDITVRNADNQPLKNLVVYDRLEHAAVDRGEVENDPCYPFPADGWHGTFQSVEKTGLEELGIVPVVYCNADRSAILSAGTQEPKEVLTRENGWYPEEEFERETGKGREEIRAVAVDLGRTERGEFELGSLKSVTFQIRMKAPQERPVSAYTYNNPFFYAVHTGTHTAATVAGNSVRVGIKAAEQLELVKELDGDVPEKERDTSFAFTLYQKEDGKRLPFANQEYELWRRTGGDWERQGDRLYATDAGGGLALCGGEKAVFREVPDAGRIDVEEEEHLFWRQEKAEILEEGQEPKIRRLVMTNTYRPVLFVQKKLEGAPAEMEAGQEAFLFQLLAGEEPLARVPFWYVDRVRTDGGSPRKLGMGTTGVDGTFLLRAGQVAAFFPGPEGTVYTLKEQMGEEARRNWICGEDCVRGTLSAIGSSVVVRNFYRWKDLLLTKKLTHQDPEDCAQAFSFCIRKVGPEGQEPLRGNAWALLDEHGVESQEAGQYGILDEAGEFTCACAGKTVKIKGLEAGETYLVRETHLEEIRELYVPMQDTEEVTMPVYSREQRVEFTNDYRKRPLSVTKIVAGDPLDKEAGEQLFTLQVELDGKPLGECACTLMQKGREEGSLWTDAEGKLRLKNGQTACFEAVAVAGTTFRVTEMPTEGYPQIYPLEGKPAEGRIGAEGSAVTFLNGTEGSLYLSKEYSYKKADRAAGEYVEQMKLLDSETGKKLREEAAVTLTLEVTDRNGEKRIWPSEAKEVTVIDQLTGEISTVFWPKQGTLSLEPWKTAVISSSDLEGVESYCLMESEADAQRILFYGEEDWLEISQQERSNGGRLQENPVAVLENEAGTVTPRGSGIEKRMSIGSQEVPEGARLVWLLERYDGAGWRAGEGISYLTFDEAGVTCTQTRRTGADGRIILEKTKAGYPCVQFLAETVRLNDYGGTPAVGDLRLRELAEESDESWGLLAGYGTAEDPWGYSLQIDRREARAFVNANRMAVVEIEKEMEQSSETVFTLFLRQVLAMADAPSEELVQILETEPRPGIEYRVFDRGTGREMGSGLTGSKGEIRLQAGTYARLFLPDGTFWTVYEDPRPDHRLKEVRGTAGVDTWEGVNLAVVQAKAETMGRLAVTAKRSRIKSGEPLQKSDFTVRACYSDGRSLLLGEEAFSISPQEAPTQAGPMEVTVRSLSEGLEGTAALEVIGEIKLDWRMVAEGVVDAESGQRVVLNTGEVEVPEYIFWDGKEYQVIGIDYQAFYNRKEITGFKLPDSVYMLDRYAFSGCSGLKGDLRLPQGVTILRDQVFSGCTGLDGNLILPEGLQEIGASAFKNCSKLKGELKLPEGITCIEASVFENCTGLSGRLVIPERVTEIKKAAFGACGGFTELVLPAGLTRIEENAFKQCRGLSGTLRLPKHVNFIGESAFQSCSGLTGLVFPEELTTIGYCVFGGCSGIAGVLEIPDGIEIIDAWAFGRDYGLTEIRIPDSVTSIGGQAFYECKNLTRMVIPPGVKEIGEDAFRLCAQLTEIVIENEEGAPGSPTGAPWGAGAQIVWAGTRPLAERRPE